MTSEFQKIQQLVSAGRAAEALPLAARFTRDHPGDAQGWFVLAGVQSMLGQLDEVIACCRRVTELDPTRFDALYNLGVALQQRGQFDEAAECYRRAVALKPDFAPAHANLGMALWKLERLDEAEAASREAIRLDPNQVQAGNNLGLILRARNRLDEAVAVLSDVVRRAPGMPEGRRGLAMCLWSLERTKDAREHFEEAVRLAPNDHESHAALGRIAIREKRYVDAIVHFKQACESSPDNPGLWMQLAEAHWGEENYKAVIRAIERALKINPDSAKAHDILGCAHLEISRKENFDVILDAEACFRKAIEIRPDYVGALTHLADTLSAKGDDPEALDLYRRALDIAPEYPPAIGGAVFVLDRFGKYEDARRLLAPAIEKGIDNIALALPYATISRYTGEKEQAAALLEKMLADEGIDGNSRREGHFILGKIQDADGNYDQAFRHYRAANDMSPGAFDYRDAERTVNSIISAFQAEATHRRPRASNRSRLPVFIVGMPRSGTTLTEQILASHPLVHGAGELMHMGKINMSLPGLTGAPWPQCVDRLDRKLLDRLAQEHLDTLGRLAGGKARVTDKMPHNFLLLGLIDLLFPEARVIHCRRDPMDNCLSIYFQPFNVNHMYGSNLEHLGIYYRLYERLMAHWRTVLRVPMMEFHYEALVAEPERQVRKLVEFCGLDWDERCLRFHESDRAIATHSYEQVRQPIYGKSVARWKRYEQYLEPLKRALDYVESADRLTGS